MFASMLMLNRHFQMQLFFWRFKDQIYTAVIAQDDTVTFEWNHVSYSAFIPMSKVDQSRLRIHEVPPLQ